MKTFHLKFYVSLTYFAFHFRYVLFIVVFALKMIHSAPVKSETKYTLTHLIIVYDTTFDIFVSFCVPSLFITFFFLCSIWSHNNVGNWIFLFSHYLSNKKKQTQIHVTIMIRIQQDKTTKWEWVREKIMQWTMRVKDLLFFVCCVWINAAMITL